MRYSRSSKTLNTTTNVSFHKDLKFQQSNTQSTRLGCIGLTVGLRAANLSLDTPILTSILTNKTRTFTNIPECPSTPPNAQECSPKPNPFYGPVCSIALPKLGLLASMDFYLGLGHRQPTSSQQRLLSDSSVTGLFHGVFKHFINPLALHTATPQPADTEQTYNISPSPPLSVVMVIAITMSPSAP